MSKMTILENNFTILDNTSTVYPRLILNKNNKQYSIQASTSLADNNVQCVMQGKKYGVLLPTDAAQNKYLWRYEFTTSSVENVINLHDIINDFKNNVYATPTLTDIYGRGLDNKCRHVRIRWIGYSDNRLYENVGGLYVNNELDIKNGLTDKNPDGWYSYDDTNYCVTFSRGSNSQRVYIIEYLNNSFSESK